MGVGNAFLVSNVPFYYAYLGYNVQMSPADGLNRVRR